MSELVSYQFSNGIARLTLSNGKVNAVSPAVVEAFNKALDQAEQDKAVVVITGQPGILSGGYDLKVMTSSVEAAKDLVAAGSTLARRMRSLLPALAMLWPKVRSFCFRPITGSGLKGRSR